MEGIQYQEVIEINVNCCISHAKEQTINTLVFTAFLPNKFVQLQEKILMETFQLARSKELHPIIVIKNALEKTKRISRSTSLNASWPVSAKLTERKAMIVARPAPVKTKRTLKSTN